MLIKLIAKLRMALHEPISIFSLLALSVAFSASPPTYAHAQTAPSQTVTAPARSFDMPIGQAAPAVAGPPKMIPRPRTPGGPDASRRSAPAAGESRDQPIPPAGPDARKSSSGRLSVLTSCQTNSASGNAPSDIIGAAGPANLVVVTNTSVGVYNKITCASLSSVLLDSLFAANTAGGESFFDPQVLWDNVNGRFIVTAESCTGTCPNGGNQRQGYAVSKDATGTSWWVYTVDIYKAGVGFCVPTSTSFWDYPHVGSVNGANPKWMIAANVFFGASAVANVLTFDKKPTLTGAVSTTTCLQNFQPNLAPVNVLDDSNIGYLLSPGSGAGSAIKRYAFDTGANTITPAPDIAVPAWAVPASDPAQPNGVTLDGLDGRFNAQTVQFGSSLWNTHAVASGTRWIGRLYKLSTSGTAPLFTRDLFTSGTDNIFNVSIAANVKHAFVSATRTDPSAGPGPGNAAMLAFSGPNFANVNGAIGWTFDLVSTSGAQYSPCPPPAPPCRWGDNSGTQLDAVDNSNGWAFNQLATGTSEFNWTTQASQHSGPLYFNVVGSGDLNGDNRGDLLWRTTSGDLVTWNLNGAALSFATNIGRLPMTWSVAGTGKFDANATSDILVRNSDGQIVLYLMSTSSTISSGVSLGALSTDWRIIGTGDFDGNGTTDILLRNANGDMVIWFMNGTAYASGGAIGNLGPQWTVAGTAKFNNDVKTDIVLRNATTGDIVIWLMNGAGVLHSASLGVLALDWKIVGFGNFNSGVDAMEDILVHNPSTGALVVYLMNGDVIQSGVGMGSLPVGWSVVAVKDLNGDGNADIVVRNDQTGDVVGYITSGTSIVSGALIGNRP